MKTKSILFIIFLFSLNVQSQISVSSDHRGRVDEFEKGVLEKFKTTTTIFVLSDVYSEENYESILKSSWSVTPFKIIAFKDFNVLNYLNGTYSFVSLDGCLDVNQTGSSFYEHLHNYIDIYMFQEDKLKNKISKLDSQNLNYTKKFNNLLDEYHINISRIELFIKNDFEDDEKKILKDKNGKVLDFIYSDNMFKNYQIGFLKNYFQKINQLINDDQLYWMYESDVIKDIINLKNEVLFIPEYSIANGNSFPPHTDIPASEKEIKKLFENYKFKYQTITNDDLNNKILNNEEFYYLRYANINAQKFINIVNGKTGDIIYRDYEVMSIKIKEKDINRINKAIEKVDKKNKTAN